MLRGSIEELTKQCAASVNGVSKDQMRRKLRAECEELQFLALKWVHKKSSVPLP